jgi:flagellar motor switch protein FliM
MANQYSVEIHKYISDKIAAATSQQKKAEAADDTAARRFSAGQLYELEKIREYMAQNIDLKTQKYY